MYIIVEYLYNTHTETYGICTKRMRFYLCVTKRFRYIALTSFKAAFSRQWACILLHTYAQYWEIFLHPHHYNSNALDWTAGRWPRNNMTVGFSLVFDASRSTCLFRLILLTYVQISCWRCVFAVCQCPQDP